MAGKLPSLNETNPRTIVEAIRDLFFGRSLAVGTVTLTANQATTVVTAINCGEQSQIFLFPKHANAAAELGNGTAYISAVGLGQFTIAHANAATANRTFGWVALG